MTLPNQSGLDSWHLILASQSPRRRQLLQEAGYRYQVFAPDEDGECGICSESGPAGMVAELAFRKAAAVVGKLGNSIRTGTDQSAAMLVLAADTVAECNGLILGKPRDEADARAMLTQLSGRDHRVLTGVCLWPLKHPLIAADARNDGEKRADASGDAGAPSKEQQEKVPLVRVAVTRLRMDPLSPVQLEEYLASGQWEGKAGAFGYQDRLGWVHIVEGSPSNVVGLPLELLAEMLNEITQPR
jgi:septum formation protein